MDTIQGNRLIAEFMGAKMIVTDYHGINIIEFPNKSTKDLHGLQYNNSYDWLMPVWFKCQKWYVREFGLLTSTFELSSIGIIIKANSDKAFRWASSFSPDGNYDEMKLLWGAVVKFITWYNDYTKTI